MGRGAGDSGAMVPSGGSAQPSFTVMFLYSLWVELDIGDSCCQSASDRVPQWMDQPTNAMFLVDVLGVGVWLKADAFTRDEVARCIAEVTDGEKATEMKKAVARCKEMTRASVRSMAHLSGIYRHLGTISWRMDPSMNPNQTMGTYARPIQGFLFYI
ncbi:hypothetical protein AMTR_s00047p00225590 [Amborella trichopoda]|uniref:Uncharacterized protein n=1 Tax=Amborella trichopoda TaxID=13333 RepID=U5DBW0_AMBTC|nr:hypothetical protein AMTR_s00047p00225590 [Amborella trichopoda]